jgi:uncharacterized membrane protein
MDKSEDATLRALATMGRILLIVPIVAGAIVTIIEAPSPSWVDWHTVLAGAALVMLCGLVTLGYVAVKRFRRGLQGED